METIKSTRCHLGKHAEFSIHFDRTRVLEPDVKWLVHYLESEVVKGSVFSAGQTIQIGWMVLKVTKENDEHLTLQEPDFCEMPIRFNPSVNNTLGHLRMQKDAFESLSLPAALKFPSILQSVIVCSKHDDSGGFIMSRVNAEQNDSGWFVGCADANHNHNDPQNLKRVSLYELACSREMIIPFISFPEEVSVFFNSRSLKIQFKGQAIEPRKHSYLQQWLNKHQISHEETNEQS
jgi:hypothetical protein